MLRVWLALILLLPGAAAQETLYAHSTAEGLVLSPDPEDPRRDGNIAPPQDEEGAAAWAFRLDPPTDEVWLLGGSNVTAGLGIGAETGSGNIDVAWTLTSGSTLLARGPPEAVLYTVGYEEVAWEVPLEASAHDPRGGDLWWNVTAIGTYSQVFLSVAGADRSMVDLPVTERQAIVEPPRLEVRNVTGSRVEIRWGLDQPSDRNLVYHWSPPGDFELRFNTTLSAGTASARLADAQNVTRWQASWPGAGHGALLLRNASANWTLGLRFGQAVGSLEVVMEGVPVQTVTTRTERGSPAAGPLLLLACLVVARRRG